MKFHTLAGSALVLAIAACGGGDQEATAGEPAETEAVVDDAAVIAEMTDYFETHYNMGHGSMVADLYAEDATFMSANGQVLEGREAIATYFQTGMDAMGAQIDIDQAEQMIFGDMAVARGNYSITAEADGEAVSYGGAFLNLLGRSGDSWQVHGAVSNYAMDAGDLWVGMPEGTEAPPEGSTMTSLIEAYETHYNLGHPSMVADLFTADAAASFAGQGWISGSEAINESVAAGMEQAPGQLDIHGVQTIDLGDGTALDTGWYEFMADGEQASWGTYALVGQQNADGEWRIHWLVANASPAPQG
ncbi:MAG: SgcJ/EcaC family oxidoreductase [Gemmatimonadetes bacterium]|nr:SgcJ/EcaC family oxidoreductase [Gemmatimonadota bacterium]